MKMRRFTPAGIIAVKDFLADIKASGQLDLVRRDQLLAGPLTEPIPALADLDLDTARIFDTTFAFCEYFDSLIHDHNPHAYRTDVGFWTWLAMAYLPQLVNERGGQVSVGNHARYVYGAENYQRHYRHLLAGPYYLYLLFRTKAEICRAVMHHRMSVHPDLTEQVVSRQDFAQNPAYMATVNALYFDSKRQVVRRGATGSGAGSPRNLVKVLDQLALTRDFYDVEDLPFVLSLLPSQFDRYKFCGINQSKQSK